MISRTVLKDLTAWLNKPQRKPLILRGARQVGKTTLVKIFSGRFRQFLHFNLEKKEDRDIFEQNMPFEKLVEALFFLRDKNPGEPSTLIFIDEIQNSPKAVESLRYFYETRPEIPVIAAGSLLEVVIDQFKISFPVGRVEYMYLYPLSFCEYLEAVHSPSLLHAYFTTPVPEYAHNKLLLAFHEYALLGGMPEAVSHYAEHRNLADLSSIYESLLTSYIDDAAKYSSNRTMFQVIRHAIESAPLQTGRRIRFQGFGNSAYGSREMGEALRTLERAMLIYLLYPATGFELPILPDKRKSPRLQFVDIGLVNYRAGIQGGLLGVEDLNAVFKGMVSEQVVGQELLSRHCFTHNPPVFWVREKAEAQAELDFLYIHRGTVVPLEVKSGKTGTLRSLHQFIDISGEDLAIRLYAGKLALDETKTPSGKTFRLLNLPYYLAGGISEYIDWACSTQP